jgi:hypothetical protein
MNILKDRRGYSMTFLTVFFGFVLIPITALGIELGRYFYVRAEIAKAADAVALAAAGGSYRLAASIGLHTQRSHRGTSTHSNSRGSPNCCSPGKS